MADMRGWGELGAVLGGAGRNNPDLVAKVERQVYDSARAMEMAKRERAVRMMAETRQQAHGGITGELLQRVALGDPVANAEAAALFAQSAATPNFGTVTQGMGNLQDQDYQRKAATAWALGDQEGAQAMLVGAGKPLRVNDVDSGYQLNPYELGGDVVALPGVQAQVRQRNAQADLYDAKREAPERFRTPPKGVVDVTSAEAIVAGIEQDSGPLPPADRAAALAALVSGQPVKLKVPTLGDPDPSQPAAPKSAAEFAALPSGTVFIAPDGTRRVKP